MKTRTYVDLSHVGLEVRNRDDDIDDRRETHEESGHEQKRRAKWLPHACDHEPVSHVIAAWPPNGRNVSGER
jgi:hypothetical protein